MIRIAPTSYTVSASTHAGSASEKPTWIGAIFNALAEANRRQREKRQLQNLDSDRLRDIGMTSTELDQMFFRMYGVHRSDDKAPITSPVPW